MGNSAIQRVMTQTPTKSSAAEVTTGTNDSKFVTPLALRNGDVRRTTMARWHTVNGYGSSSDKIQKFAIELTASDDVVVTIVNSATLGFTITANMDCMVHITYTGNFSAGVRIGLSLNSTELTTAIQSITPGDRLVSNYYLDTNEGLSINWSGLISSGDVIRPHTSGVSDGALPSTGNISVLAIEKL